MIKKIIRYLSVFILLLLIIGCKQTSSNSNNENIGKGESIEDPQDYNSYVKSFDLINTDETNHLLDQDKSFILYTGRITCPHCRIFVPKLYTAVSNLEENNVEVGIYYLNSENDKDLGLENFRNKYDIPYVPDLSYFKDGVVSETMDITDETTSEEIEKFISLVVN